MIQIKLENWGTEWLRSSGYILEGSPEVVLTTPWSTIIRFVTGNGNFYLKQTPPAVFLSSEPKVIQILASKSQDSLPIVVAINDDLHCFIMHDAGMPLRQSLKAEFNVQLMCQAIKQYTEILHSTENNIDTFIKLGIPDWRLDKLPMLYDQMLKRTEFLINESMTDKELQRLQALSPQFLQQCELLASYKIPATLGFHDFHDKNVLFAPNSKKMTISDWGETAIIHPFLSLYNCLPHAITHHGIKVDDHNYVQLRNACVAGWEEIATQDKLLAALDVASKIWIFYSVLCCYQCMMDLDIQAYKAYYADKPSVIATHFRMYMLE